MSIPVVSPVRTAAIQRTLLIILVLNLVVVVVKAVVGVRSGSLTVIGATLESFLDALNNVIAVVIVALAARGPDEDHPYGHDKFETMGALAIVGFLSISCFELIRGGIARLTAPPPTQEASTLEVGMLAATALVNVVVVWYERRRGRELSSPLLLADAAHTAGDLFVTALAIASLLATRAGIPWADPVLAMIVALIIAYSGFQILKVTVPVLVDERGVSAERVRTVCERVPGVAGTRGVRSRVTSSGTLFVEVTIVVPAGMAVADAHTIADAVELALADGVGAADVTVHVEPS
jgi:cation diffusion facilitator family transporter